MVSGQLSRDDLKQVFKEALIESLHEQRELFHEVIRDVLEDFALVEAIREGQKTDLVSRDEVLQLLQDDA